MVRAAFRVSCRRAGSPTRTPAGVNATMDGSSAFPSASGRTRGMPPSTYATRLLVVPRSMPTMRGTRLPLLSERLAQVVDHRRQIRARGERFLEPPEQPRAIATFLDGGVPLRAPRFDLPVRLLATRQQPLALLAQPRARRAVESRRPRLLQALLQLHHFLEQIHRGPGLRGRALRGVAPLLERDQVLDAGQRLAQRPVRAVHQRRLRQRLRLLRLARELVEIRVVSPREIVETPAQLVTIHCEPSRKPEHVEIVAHRLRK